MPDADAQQRQQARVLARQAVASGTLTRPPACESCGTPGPVQGHHSYYARPLSVTWLCRACHALEHPAPAQQRAEAELRADPARSDRDQQLSAGLIAGCEPVTPQVGERPAS
jgi:hypothetical protein